MPRSHHRIALFALFGLAAAMAALPLATTAQHVVIPNTHQNAWGDGGRNTMTRDFPRSTQMVLPAADLTALAPGDLITAVAWRGADSGSNPAAWPVGSDANWASFDVYLATSAVAPGNISTTFAANRGGDFTLVRSGPLTIPRDSLVSYFGDPSPGPWEHEIVFDTPFAYGGGHLLVEVRHTGNDTGTRFFLDRREAGQSLRSIPGSYTATTGTIEGSFTITRLTFQSSSPPPCVPGPTVLCMDDTPGDARFRATLIFATSQGGGLSGSGQAISLASLGVRRGGLFWFFDSTNPELLIKVLDGCGITGHFWVFFSAGTNVGFTLEVVDTQENRTWTYVNPDRTPAPPVQDGQGFPCS